MTIAKEREIIDLADEDDDQGTADKLTAYCKNKKNWYGCTMPILANRPIDKRRLEVVFFYCVW